MMKTTPPWPVLRCQRPGHPSSPWRLLCPSLPCTHVALFPLSRDLEDGAGALAAPRGAGGGVCMGEGGGLPHSTSLGEVPRAGTAAPRPCAERAWFC